jgi:hypothetical protein
VTEYPETPCLDYYEHQRSLRVERIDPPPEVPTPEGTITATLLLSPTQPLSVTVPITAPSE